MLGQPSICKRYYLFDVCNFFHQYVSTNTTRWSYRGILLMTTAKDKRGLELLRGFIYFFGSLVRILLYLHHSLSGPEIVIFST